MTRKILSLLALAWWSIAAVAHSEDAPPPIREFDIPTIERLGREMYEQDQLAWKATDILFTKHSKDELRAQKQHGWTVDSFPDHQVVRFIRDTDLGPMLAYDVTFTAGQALTYSEPQSALLSGDELAQYNARMLAIQSVDRPCAKTYNTVALKDPQGDGWLVWAMAATTNPDEIIVGGHYRFTISKDGKSILRKDALSRGCLVIPKPHPNKDEDVLGAFIGHLVSLTPIETYVFDSLSYDETFNIGTLDGKAWKVAGGHITEINMDMADGDGTSARVLAGLNENCFALFKDHDGKYQNVHLSSIIQQTEKKGGYKPDVDSSDDIKLITCGRSDFYLAPNDYKVLFAGFPFQIVDKGVGHPDRSGTLYIQGGQFKFDTDKGTQPTPSQWVGLQKRLNDFQLIQQGGK